MNIITNFLEKNKYSRPGIKRNKTTKIAWHYVGNAGSSAEANRNYFNNAQKHKTSASSHYIIGLSGEIIYCIPEIEVAYTTNSANCYSIGIEMCHPDNSGKFNALTYNAAVELGADLARRYKLNPLTDFIRHFDVTKKICPKYWVDKPTEWQKFKQDVFNKLNSISVNTGSYTVRVITDTLNVRSGPSTSYNVVSQIKKGAVYTIVGEKDNWGKLKSGTGWITLNSLYVEKTSTSITNTPTIEQSFKNGDYTGRTAKVVANTLNVRFNRGTNYNIIGKLKKYDKVKLSYCLNGWISIKGFKGNKGLGYVSTEYLELI